jgi:hypothetical protein
LVSSRWSWGALRPDGVVFLRVWQDQVEKRSVRLADHAMFKDKPNNLGWRERQEHIRLISNGAPCYMIMCLAEDNDASARIIKSFNRKYLFVGGSLEERDSDEWIELTDKISVVAFNPNNAPTTSR